MTWSPEQYRLHGVEPANGPPTFEQWLDLVEPEDRAAILDAEGALLAPGTDDLRLEFRIRRASDGTPRWLASLGRLIRDADGRPSRIIGANLDITQAKQAEVALRQSEERFRATFEQAAVGMAHTDLDLNWIRVNDRFCDMLGYTRAELLGMTFQDVTHPDDLEANLASLRQFLTGEIPSVTIEKRYIRKDGAHLWVTVTASMARDRTGVPQYFMAVVEDISARKLAEAALRESEARFRTLFDAAPLPNFLVDPSDLSIADCNEAAAATLGYPRDVLRSMPISDIDADLETVDLRARSAVLQGVPIQFETRHRTRHGELRDVVVALVPVDIAGRRLSHCTVVDITERKRAEAGFRRLTADLEAQVLDAVAARESAQLRAAQAERMQALGQLAGGIAHDFNNVLQAVQGSGAMIGRHAADEAAVRHYARILGEAADRGASITRRLLAFARPGDLRAEAIEPCGLLEGMREILAPTLGAEIRIVVDAGPDLPVLLADRSQLETALVNLATNARDAMPRGGTLTLAAAAVVLAEGDVHRAGIAPGRYVRIAVADTGEGMDETVLKRVFQPFFTTKPQGRGTGLGLAMVKGFAEQSGGGVAVDSTPGKGTTVTIWLPQDTAGTGQPGDVVRATPLPPRLTRVLVVDDNPLVRETVAAQLQDEGFAVTTAESGPQALTLLDEGLVVEALVSDLAMQLMDGASLIQQAQVRRPGLAAILLTGYADEDVSLAMGRRIEGPFVLMQKPSPGSQLASRIAELVAQAGEAAPGMAGPGPADNV